jgi:Fe2+ or Zn2+ uptake regulation protein
MKNNKQQSKIFYQALNDALNNLSSRSQDIVKKRFGVGYENIMTLQYIGDEYGVSRERVRQIVSAGIKETRQKKELLKSCRLVESQILNYIQAKNQIFLEQDILDELGENDLERGSIRFFLEVIEELEIINPKKFPVLEKTIIHNDLSLEEWNKINQKVVSFFKAKNKVYEYDELYNKLFKNSQNINKSTLKNYLEVSSEIDYNVFDKWGMMYWDDINPKGVREKAVIILQENQRPMHFSQITKEINQSGLNSDGILAQQQTVHNELIKNENFVLVGRGIYALKSWGYENGTVEDVVVDILKKAEKPLPAQEVVANVLEVRNVRPATIMVNLNAVAQKFDGKYILA